VRCARGFTLVEVLVALAIVAIALLAGGQATSALTRTALRQTDIVLGHVCAENALVTVRLMAQLPALGTERMACQQGGQTYQVAVTVSPTPNPQFRRVDAQVLDARQWPVLKLSTIVGRY